MSAVARIPASALMRHVEVLTDRFPHRHTGEPDERAAAEYVAEVFAGLDLKTRVHELSVMGWELSSPPSLTLFGEDSIELECVPFIFSGSTPRGGLRGRLEYVGPTPVVGLPPPWEKFAILGADDRPRAFVVGRPLGPAIAQSGPPAGSSGTQDGPHYTWPACAVGSEDLALIRRLAARGKVEAELHIEASYKPGSPSFVVQADLEAAGDENLIVIGAHHDCQGAVGFPSEADSPGGCDNASGVAAVLELARHYAEHGARRSLRFCTYGGEEWNLTGSRHYVRMLAETGELSRVRAKINLDQTAGGEQLHVQASDDRGSSSMAAVARAKVSELDIEREYEVAWHVPPMPGSDHWPYACAGVPIFYAFWDPIPHYHRAGDTAAACTTPERYEAAVALTQAVIGAVSGGSA